LAPFSCAPSRNLCCKAAAPFQDGCWPPDLSLSFPNGSRQPKFWFGSGNAGNSLLQSVVKLQITEKFFWGQRCCEKLVLPGRSQKKTLNSRPFKIQLVPQTASVSLACLFSIEVFRVAESTLTGRIFAYL
jgi:hypothetical protein